MKLFFFLTIHEFGQRFRAALRYGKGQGAMPHPICHDEEAETIVWFLSSYHLPQHNSEAVQKGNIINNGRKITKIPTIIIMMMIIIL